MKILPTYISGGKAENILEEMWQEARQKGKRLSFRIMSGSMSPTIEAGNVVRVKRVPPSRMRTGDIAAFYVDSRVVVHRLIGKTRRGRRLKFCHRGDAASSSGKISADSLIGKVAVIEKEGYEINLESPGQVVADRLLGWRLGFVDAIGRSRRRRFGRYLRMVLKPAWRLCRFALVRNPKG